MLADRYDLGLTTASAAARDAYVQACDLFLTLYPGVTDAFDRAIAADPGFALAHSGKAQMLTREGKFAAARDAMSAANAVAAGLSEREASHLAFVNLLMSGQAKAALAALYAHLDAWPRDALVLSTAANPNGLIGTSGRIGQKHEIAALLDRLAPQYGDDAWFMSHHAMALSEDGRLDVARAKIERSVAQNPHNANAAHGYAHVCYEEGDANAGRAFLASWLATYPRDGFFHGHLSWHRALGELEVGNVAEAFRLYREAFSLDNHSGGPQQKMSDATAFLWRAELAGQPRDAAAWRAMHDFACSTLTRAGNGLEDLHVILSQAVASDDDALATRVRQMEDLARDGRYPSGPYLPALARAFAAFEQRNYAAAIEAMEPFAGENERIGGSRAQHDLIDFTLLKAYLNSDREEDARRFVRARRTGPSCIPVAGLAALH
jgi:tetratricopeptide (TPR) repeat protein